MIVAHNRQEGSKERATDAITGSPEIGPQKSPIVEVAEGGDIEVGVSEEAVASRDKTRQVPSL